MKDGEAYIETSVLLRILFREPERISNLKNYPILYSSVLLRTESYRTVYRVRLQKALDDDESSEIFARLIRFLGAITLLPLTPRILHAAEQFFPTHIATLDAIHLSSALALKGIKPNLESFLTHDAQLGRAAISMGLRVSGTVSRS